LSENLPVKKNAYPTGGGRTDLPAEHEDTYTEQRSIPAEDKARGILLLCVAGGKRGREQLAGGNYLRSVNFEIRRAGFCAANTRGYTLTFGTLPNEGAAPRSGLLVAVLPAFYWVMRCFMLKFAAEFATLFVRQYLTS
jgi:hypothetical protein